MGWRCGPLLLRDKGSLRRWLAPAPDAWARVAGAHRSMGVASTLQRLAEQRDSNDIPSSHFSARPRRLLVADRCASQDFRWRRVQWLERT
jgi:hypothetical protein